jgi:hypothetical protein
MQDLRWEDVGWWFDAEWQGVLPDGQVQETSIADWQTFLDLIRSEGWAFEYSVGGDVEALPDSAEEMFDRPDDDSVMVQVRPVPDVLVNVFVWDSSEIGFDVDIRELQGQRQLDVLCSFFRRLGRSVGKPVVMTPEGTSDAKVLVYEPDHDRFLWLAKRAD